MSVLVCPECYGNGYITQHGGGRYFVSTAYPFEQDVRCPWCGGEGRIGAEEAGIECNYGLEALALREWREANPDGLVGRLVELYRRDPRRALLLARYIERYYANASEPGEPWPYQWLAADVASWRAA